MNVIWNRIEMIIRNEIDEMCPIKKIKVVDRNDPRITREIIELMHDKDTWRKKAKKSNNPENWAKARALRNLVNKCISNAKRDFVIENLKRHEKDSKKFWENIYAVVPGKDKCKKINLIDRNSKLPVDNDRLPDYISEYFANIGNRLADQFSGNWHSPMETLEVELGEINFTEKDVIEMCQNIDIGKSSALDNLSNKVLKDAFLAAPQVLTHCFKKSVETGVFPMACKRALVVPLFKGGDPSDVNNLRPVSLLPLPGKLLERLIHTHISTYLETNGLLDERQGEFRKGHSTISTIAEFTDDLFEDINNNQLTLATFIDLRKAFDTVNHFILLQKLLKLGIKDKIFEWVKSYLSKRSQCTIVNGIRYAGC